MKYLIRLDDACETMNFKNWFRMEELLDKYNIKPIVAIVPNNKDENLIFDQAKEDFWELMLKWQNKDWALSLHGNTHVYETNSGGINPIHKRSEFAGLPLSIQRNKIKEGYVKLIKKGINPIIFVAPSHTFDENTLKALMLETPIRIISDTVAFNIYKENDFIFIPQQFGLVRNVKINGLYTFCYHPNTMTDRSFLDLEKFLEKHSAKFTSINNLDLSNPPKKSIFDKFYAFTYYMFRKIFR